MGKLDGKIALVVGGSPNNGGTIAHFLAKEGAKIAVADMVGAAADETAKFLQSKGFDAFGLGGDASEIDDVQAIVRATMERYEKIDILVNMAGKQYRWSVLDVNIHDWNRVIKGYLTSAMLTTKYVAREMVEQKIAGSIIHIASDAAHQGEPGNCGYSAAKGGLVNFCRAAAMDLSQYGIRVNTISPTYIEHNIWRFEMTPTLRRPFSSTGDDFLQGIPLGRFCRTSDVAYAAAFLASEESSFITGADLPLDGGARAKYWPWKPGEFRGTRLADYIENATPTRYGE